MADQYRLLRGVHQDPGPSETAKKYKRGDVIQSDKDLVAMFGKARFQKLVPGQAVTPLPSLAETATVDPLALDPVQNPLDAPPEKPSLGDDVTESFGLAKQKHVKVFYDGTKFSVTDETETTTAMNDEETLADDKAVAKFLKKLPD